MPELLPMARTTASNPMMILQAFSVLNLRAALHETFSEPELVGFREDAA